MTLAAAFMVAAAAGDPSSVLALAQSRYREVSAYRATLRSTDARGKTEVIRYFYKMPGFVRMEFVEPMAGGVLLYDPEKKQARVWPLGRSGPSMSLSPDNRLIRSSHGHRVDRSDVGALLANLHELERAGGKSEALGEETVDGRRLLHLRVRGAPGKTVEGVHRYDIWLQDPSLFPARVESYGAREDAIEAVVFGDVALDPPLADDVFTTP